MSGGIVSTVNEVTIVRGSSKTLELCVTDSEGHAIDLTGARIVFTMKCRIEDEQNVLQKDSDNGATEIEITEPREGKAKIKISPSDTQSLDLGKYVFDVWVVLASGEKHLVVGPADLILVGGVTVLC